MKRTLIACVMVLIPIATLGHDMFLVVPDHNVPAESDVTVALYNGTFDKSENTIDRERMIDVSVVDGTGQISNPAAKQWREEGTATLLDLRTGSPGTYVLGISTKARMIELTAEEFNDYLEHDGVIDVLEQRRKAGTLDRPAKERYSKHVKTILQVGKTATDSYAQQLGYPLEIVPLVNPATLSPGDTLKVRVLADGEPVAGQLVYASHAGYHSHDESGDHREAIKTRTDGSGVAGIEISRSGRWYVRLIRMLSAGDDGVDYESNWATLTFQVR
jgi:uncharacterized GH25 family protein